MNLAIGSIVILITVGIYRDAFPTLADRAEIETNANVNAAKGTKKFSAPLKQKFRRLESDVENTKNHKQEVVIRLDEQLDAMQAEAEALAMDDKWQEVLDLSKRLLERYPNKPNGYYIKAMAQIKLGHRSEDTAETYLSAVSRFSNDPELSDITWDFIKENNISLHDVALQAILGANMTDEAQRFLSLSTKQQGKWSEAMKHQLDYTQYKQTHLAQEYDSLAQIYLELNLHEKALAALRQARDFRELYPEEIDSEYDHTFFVNAYVDLLRDLNYVDEARAYLKRLDNKKSDFDRQMRTELNNLLSDKKDT